MSQNVCNAQLSNIPDYWILVFFMVTNSAKNPFDRPNPNLATNKYGFALVRSVR